METTIENTAVENDYDMEPNTDGQGQVLYGNEVLKDSFLPFLNVTLAGIVIMIMFILSEVMTDGDPERIVVLFVIMIACVAINTICDKSLSKRFSKTLYKNPAVCSEKRFYMEAAKAVQNAGFETERNFFTYISSGSGLVVTKPSLFDYSMVIFYNPQSNTFSVANKKIIGKADLDNLATVIENQLYSKYCPQVVAAVQRRLEQCANSVERCKEEDLNSDNSGLVKTFATSYLKSLIQSAVIILAILILLTISSIIL